MTTDVGLVVADEWQVTLFVDVRAPAELVRRWCLSSHAALAATVIETEQRLRLGGGGRALRLALDP